VHGKHSHAAIPRGSALALLLPEPERCIVLRRTAASARLSGGADIVAVAAWLGDTVETVYKTYAHLMPDADDRGRKAIDQFFSGPEMREVP